MELQFPSLQTLLCFLLFIYVVLKLHKRSKINDPNSKLPPSPRKLPIIGNIHNLVGSSPHHRLRDLAKVYGPLMHLQLGEISAVVASSPETAKQVMKTHDTVFATRPFLLSASIMSYDFKGVVFTPYGPYWREMRKICMLELLNAKRVQSFRSIREEEVSNLITVISAHAGSAINLSEKLFTLTNHIVTRAAFGKKSKDTEAFISVIKETTEDGAGFSVADVFPSLKWLHKISGVRPKIEKTHQKSDRILKIIIDEHKESRKKIKSGTEGEAHEDLVDVLLKLQERDDLGFSLTTDHIKGVIFDIFAAGSETSSTTVEWAMSEMLKNPIVLRKAQEEVRKVFGQEGNVNETKLDELNYLKLVMKETLRLHPPAPLLLPRECQEKCEINGYVIPERTKVIINAWAIGRDNKYWAEADSFVPERFLGSSVDYKGTDFEFIPFGAGRRMCPGIVFGTANVLLPLAQMLYHFDWKLPDGAKEEGLDMTESFGATIRRKNDLYVVPIANRP